MAPLGIAELALEEDRSGLEEGEHHHRPRMLDVLAARLGSVMQLHAVGADPEEPPLVRELRRDLGFGEILGRLRRLCHAHIEAVIARTQRSMSHDGMMPRASVAMAIADSSQRVSARGSIVTSPAGASMYMRRTIRK